MEESYNSLNQEFPSNAKSEKHVKEAVAKAVKTVDTPKGKKLLRMIFAEDGKTVANYIFKEVILPEVKRLFYDIIINGSHRMIFGEGAAPIQNSTITPYSSISNTRSLLNTGITTTPRTNNYSVYDYNNLVLSTKMEAEAILVEMIRLYKAYGFVSVGDLFDLASCETKSTDYDYGWSYDISTTPIRPYAGGYIIDLPKAMPRR